MDKTIYSEGHKVLVNKLIKARKERGFRQGDVARLLGRKSRNMARQKNSLNTGI